MAIASPISPGLSWPRKLIATELGSGDRHRSFHEKVYFKVGPEFVPLQGTRKHIPPTVERENHRLKHTLLRNMWSFPGGYLELPHNKSNRLRISFVAHECPDTLIVTKKRLNRKKKWWSSSPKKGWCVWGQSSHFRNMARAVPQLYLANPNFMHYKRIPSKWPNTFASTLIPSK